MKSLPSSYDLWRAFVVLFTLNMLDAYSTAILVVAYGTNVEANPLVKYAMDLYGIGGMFMLKFVVLGFLALCIGLVQRSYMEHRAAIMVHRSTWLLNLLIAFIVINNFILVAATINT